MTHLRQRMLDELQRRNYSQSTVRSYIFAVEDFTRYFHRSPERLGPEHIRQYQAYLFRERKLSPGTIQGRTAALRFLFVKTLRRPYLPDDIPFPKRQRRLPTILDQQEVARLIDSAGNLMHRTMMMMLYATGLRRAEMCHLKVSDIDSKRMVIHVRQGKGGCACYRGRRVRRRSGRHSIGPWLLQDGWMCASGCRETATPSACAGVRASKCAAHRAASG